MIFLVWFPNPIVLSILRISYLSTIVTSSQRWLNTWGIRVAISIHINIIIAILINKQVFITIYLLKAIVFITTIPIIIDIITIAPVFSELCLYRSLGD